MKRSPLKRDPDQIRAWQNRSRQRAGLRRYHREQTLERANDRPPIAASIDRPPLRPGKGKPRVQVPPSVRQVARARSGGRCIVCVFEGKRGRACGKAEELHHVLPKGLARFSKWATESANLVGLCGLHHERQTNASMVREPDGSLRDGRVPWEALPDVTVQFIARCGGPAVDYCATQYPRSNTNERGASCR